MHRIPLILTAHVFQPACIKVTLIMHEVYLPFNFWWVVVMQNVAVASTSKQGAGGKWEKEYKGRRANFRRRRSDRNQIYHNIRIKKVNKAIISNSFDLLSIAILRFWNFLNKIAKIGQNSKITPQPQKTRFFPRMLYTCYVTCVLLSGWQPRRLMQLPAHARGDVVLDGIDGLKDDWVSMCYHVRGVFKAR